MPATAKATSGNGEGRDVPIADLADLGKQTFRNGPHHLPAQADEARCSRSGACGCYAAL